MAGDLVKRALYRSGLLGLYHRLRNRRALTVIMFHRVLTQEDPRWASCDPDYTLDAGLFERCLYFFRRHYNVVSVDQVMVARRDGTPLPDRPLLITFDDGWADNHAHALPRLRAAGLPALLFTVADVVATSSSQPGSRKVKYWPRLPTAVAPGIWPATVSRMRSASSPGSTERSTDDTKKSGSGFASPAMSIQRHSLKLRNQVPCRLAKRRVRALMRPIISSREYWPAR